MSNNYSEQRAELHKTIAKIADGLRNNVDGWDFKQYVLGTLFYRYVSENIVDFINKGEAEAGNPNFNYADLSDEEAETVREDLLDTKMMFRNIFFKMFKLYL